VRKKKILKKNSIEKKERGGTEGSKGKKGVISKSESFKSVTLDIGGTGQVTGLEMTRFKKGGKETGAKEP